MIKLYSTNCPKCKVVETKLKLKKINYELCTDVDEMLNLGIKAAPYIGLEDGSLLDFTKAVQWVNAQ